MYIKGPSKTSNDQGCGAKTRSIACLMWVFHSPHIGSPPEQLTAGNRRSPLWKGKVSSQPPFLCSILVLGAHFLLNKVISWSPTDLELSKREKGIIGWISARKLQLIIRHTIHPGRSFCWWPKSPISPEFFSVICKSIPFWWSWTIPDIYDP